MVGPDRRKITTSMVSSDQPAADDRGSRAAARAARRSRWAVRDARATRWEQRLALPVILAAIASVPAVFLTMFDDDRLRLAGQALNWASLGVLTLEAALLLLLSGDRLAWLWRHRWTLLVTVIAVPAVIYAVAPVQALRLWHLVRLIGALRILRAKTIFKAGQVLARRLGLTGPKRYALVIGGSTLAAAFVALVLVDPSTSRQHERLFQELQGWLRPVPALVAGAVLAAAVFIIVLYRRGAPRRRTRRPATPTTDPAAGPAEAAAPSQDRPDRAGG